MLELKNIRKVYRIGEVETRAVDGMTVSFREQEFVAVLGKRLGQNDLPQHHRRTRPLRRGRADHQGKKHKEASRNASGRYRNNSVGFVFQSYNLISHLSIVTNVELGMTLSGVSREKSADGPSKCWSR